MKVLAVSEDMKNKVCMNCLKELNDKSFVYDIEPLGYGSSFDGFGTRIQLCENCYNETSWIWTFEKTSIISEWGEFYGYKYEKEMLEYVDNMSIEGQELFWNRFGNFIPMKPQDWIDYELGLLPHKKCEEYGLISPEEEKAYKERFPVCEWVYITIWRDGSGGSTCVEGAIGEADGTCRTTTSDECYKCNIFSESKDIDHKAVHDRLYKLYEDYGKIVLKNTRNNK